MKKALSLIISLIIIVTSVTVTPLVGALAAQAPADSGTDRKIYFDANSTDWSDFRSICFYIYQIDGEDYYPWGSKLLRGSDPDGDNIWEYDPAEKGIELIDGVKYMIVFSADFETQTYPLRFDATCLDDVAYCTGEYLQDPVDTDKSFLKAVWTDHHHFEPVYTHSDEKIYFDANSTDWSGYSHIDFYVYKIGGDGLISWGSKKLRGSDPDGDNIWEYDPAEKGMELIDGVDYMIIFSSDFGMQTYPLRFDTTCLGDVAYCTGEYLQHPDNPNTACLQTVWTDHDFGPADSFIESFFDDDVRVRSEGGKFYFDANTVDWQITEGVRVSFGSADGRWYDAGSELGSDDDGDGIWEFDTGKYRTVLYDNQQYIVKFESIANYYYDDEDYSHYEYYTHPLLFDTSCFGDTAYCDGSTVKYSEYDDEVYYVAMWREQDPSVNGPLKRMLRDSSFVGTAVPKYFSSYELFKRSLADHIYIPDACEATGKDSQTLIDEIGQELGMTKESVERAINNTYYRYWNVWDKEKSTLPDTDESTDHLYYFEFGHEPHEYSAFADLGLTAFDEFWIFLERYRYDIHDYLTINKTETAQHLIDEIAAGFGLYKDEVSKVIEVCEIDAAWSPEDSTLPEGTIGQEYREGVYYIAEVENADENTVKNVDFRYTLRYDQSSGYYFSTGYTAPEGGSLIHVALCTGGSEFTIVTHEPVKSVGETCKFFYRPDEDGYSFGFNLRRELKYGAVATGGGVSDGKIRVWMRETNTVADGVKLSWMPVNGVKTYRLFIEENGEWKTLADVSGLKYIDTNVSSGKVYHYTVRGIGADGQYCTDYYEYGWYHRYLAAPAEPTVESTSQGNLIKWEPVSGNARYRVYVDDGSGWMPLGDTYDTEFVHTNVLDDPFSPDPDHPKPYDPSNWIVYYSKPVVDGVTYIYSVKCVSYDGYKITSAVDDPEPDYEIYLCGDADDDGEVTILDATAIQRRLAELPTSAYNEKAADADRDGEVTILDATSIQRYLAQLPTNEIVGKPIA